MQLFMCMCVFLFYVLLVPLQNVNNKRFDGCATFALPHYILQATQRRTSNHGTAALSLLVVGACLSSLLLIRSAPW